VPMEFDVSVHGLGYSLVEVHLPTLGLDARLLVLPIPVEGEQLDLRIAVSVDRRCRARGVALPLRLLPRKLAAGLLARTLLSWSASDVAADVTIWDAKQYLDPPALAPGDGPIGPYRKWCRQFYPEGTAGDLATGARVARPLRFKDAHGG